MYFIVKLFFIDVVTKNHISKNKNGFRKYIKTD